MCGSKVREVDSTCALEVSGTRATASAGSPWRTDVGAGSKTIPGRAGFLMPQHDKPVAASMLRLLILSRHLHPGGFKSNMKTIVRVCLACCFCMGLAAELPAGLITFDDLPSPPATNSLTGLFFANHNRALYHGVTWDSRVNVVGDVYRVDTGTPGPLFGIPHSGHYFITNGGQDNDGILLTTNQVLRGAWFGQNQYYGFGSGADQVTINALSGATVLASVVFELPAPTVAGQPGLMGFADTSQFASLTGITGYRIDRHELGSETGNWVADDFSFAAASVPEPSSFVLSALAFLAVGGKLLTRCLTCAYGLSGSSHPTTPSGTRKST